MCILLHTNTYFTKSDYFVVTVIPASAIQIAGGESGQNLHTLTMTNSSTGGAIVQYAQGQEFFVPGKKYLS